MSLWTTAEVAAEVQMSEEWVRDHAAELGGIRAGRTGRAPLRFEPETIDAWKRRHRLESPPTRTRPRKRPAKHPADVDLLPLPGTKAARSSVEA